MKWKLMVAAPRCTHDTVDSKVSVPWRRGISGAPKGVLSVLGQRVIVAVMKFNSKKCLALAAFLNLLAKEFHRMPFRAAILMAVILSSYASASANVYSWSGGGTTGYWSDSGNWGFAGVPNNGDTLVFPAPPALVSTTNNLASLVLAQIRFAGNGGGYTFYGNSFTLTVGIEATNSIGANVISNSITLGATNITVDVGNNAYLNLAGLVQGTAGLTKIGAGTLTYAYSGNNT